MTTMNPYDQTLLPPSDPMPTCWHDLDDDAQQKLRDQFAEDEAWDIVLEMVDTGGKVPEAYRNWISFLIKNGVETP